MMIDDVNKNPPCLPTGRGSIFYHEKHKLEQGLSGSHRRPLASFSKRSLIAELKPFYHSSVSPVHLLRLQQARRNPFDLTLRNYEHFQSLYILYGLRHE